MIIVGDDEPLAGSHDMNYRGLINMLMPAGCRLQDRWRMGAARGQEKTGVRSAAGCPGVWPGTGIVRYAR